MATDRPDPGEFLELAQRMLRELFGELRRDDEPWAEATRRPRERSEILQGAREPSADQQRENLTFALATRAVEALEDLALNVAAIRQRLERTDPQGSGAQPAGEERGQHRVDHEVAADGGQRRAQSRRARQGALRREREDDGHQRERGRPQERDREQ